LLIEPLSRVHDRGSFDCGDPDVTDFLRKKALQDQERDLSRTMILIDERDPSERILGYHTLLMMQVRQDDVPNDRPRIKRGIPVVMLGQLGIDVSIQGRGFGDLLLMDAQARTAEVAEKVGIRALMLDARNERLARWYEKHDFVRFPNSLRMFKSISSSSCKAKAIHKRTLCT